MNRHQRPIFVTALSCSAILLLLSCSGYIAEVAALPRNNAKKEGSLSLNSSLKSSRNSGNRGNSNHGGNTIQGGSGRQSFDGSARSSVVLHDSFPCESDHQASSTSVDAAPLGAATVNNKDTPPTTASSNNTPPANYLHTNSFMAQNNLDTKSTSTNISSSLNTPRGGGAIDTLSTDSNYNDDELDQMVDNLIDGLDDDQEDESDDDVSSSTLLSNEANDIEDDETEIDEDGEGTEETEEQEIDDGINIEEGAESDEEEEEELSDTTNDDEPSTSTINMPKDAQDSPIQSTSSSQPTLPNHHRPSTTKASSISIPVTPTNAYYRFLVRRGPKGHVLASFTLISIQWIYTYTPFIYKFIATILLKLHIYNPQVLYERERKRQYEMRFPKKKKKGLTSKLLFSSKNSDQALQQKALQKRDDQEAATKLKQLYKTMKVGSGMGMLSEVKYRYLSVGFRKLHGLGKQYRVEKPRTFMGEVVEGSAGDNPFERGLDEEGLELDIEFSDVEMEEAGGLVVGESTNQKVPASKQQRRPKRKKINDWVVKAFATHHKPSTKTAAAATASQLWKSVERDAILEAAWESRAAEQQAVATATAMSKGGRRRGGRSSNIDGEELDDDHVVEATSASSSGGYGASKMFQSVMTRVGKNGRILGAYPNDARPIEECARERGVIELARRYGYGDWRADREDADDLMHSDDEDGDDSWGGGDFMFGGDNSGFEMDSSPVSSQVSNGRRKTSRRKKKLSASMRSGEDAETAVVKTRRRKRSSKSNKGPLALGLSGGGTAAADAPSRLTFEFGINASTSSKQRTRQRPIHHGSRTSQLPVTLPMTSVSATRDGKQIKSQLQERKSASILLTSDTSIKAPMQLLKKSKNRLGNNDDI